MFKRTIVFASNATAKRLSNDNIAVRPNVRGRTTNILKYIRKANRKGYLTTISAIANAMSCNNTHARYSVRYLVMAGAVVERKVYGVSYFFAENGAEAAWQEYCNSNRKSPNPNLAINKVHLLK